MRRWEDGKEYVWKTKRRKQVSFSSPFPENLEAVASSHGLGRGEEATFYH